jgi:hypothetical protein
MTNQRAADVDEDADSTDGRNETSNERMDRNWNEILQRAAGYPDRHSDLHRFLAHYCVPDIGSVNWTTFQVRVYLILVIAAVLTTALGLAR